MYVHNAYRQVVHTPEQGKGGPWVEWEVDEEEEGEVGAEGWKQGTIFSLEWSHQIAARQPDYTHADTLTQNAC